MSNTNKNPTLTINFEKINEVKVKIDAYHPGSHKEKLTKGYKGFKLNKKYITK